MTRTKRGDIDKAAVKSIVILTSFAAGIPSSQANKSIEAITQAQDGQDVMPWEYGPK